MACKYAKRTDEYHGWECTNAKEPCRYPIPDRSLCSEEYKWIKGIGKRIKEPRWIPCSERLPENNTNVIVCFCSGGVTEMRYWGNGIFQGIYEHTTKVIVAWMPLPEPYKGE